MKKLFLLSLFLFINCNAFGAAPTLIASYQVTDSTGFSNPDVTKSLLVTSVVSGDCLVALGASADAATTVGTPTDTQGNTWSVAQTSAPASYAFAGGWTTVPSVTSALSVTVSRSATSHQWGFAILQFRNCSIGTSNKNNSASGTPNVTLTSVGANSAIAVINGDWNAVNPGVCHGVNSGFCSWTANAGGANNPQILVDRDSAGSQYTFYLDYYPDSGGAGNQTVGLDAPAAQKWNIVAVEVKGSGGGGGSTVHSLGALGVGN